MRLELPHFKQTSAQNCGPTALKMVLAYFGKDEKLTILESYTGIKEGKGVSTIQIATAAASLGHKTDFYSKHILFNEENLKHDYYQKYSDMDLKQSKKWVEDASTKGVRIQERTLSQKELLGFVTEHSVPIILLDWNIVKQRKGYQGHFVPITGFDEHHIYVSDPGSETGQTPISKQLFEEARKAEGTDEDVVVVYKKRMW